jgi:secondary thiamine-phosphate synthase enzyme
MLFVGVFYASRSTKAMIRTIQMELETRGHCDVQDVTSALREALAQSGIKEGQATVFVAGSTAGVTTVEFEPGLVKDLNEFFQKIIPEGPDYHHHATWGDDNGSSHVRAALLKPSLTIPFAAGKLLLGTWQQVVVIDFDTRGRRRRVVLQFMGE